MFGQNGLKELNTRDDCCSTRGGRRSSGGRRGRIRRREKLRKEQGVREENRRKEGGGGRGGSPKLGQPRADSAAWLALASRTEMRSRESAGTSQVVMSLQWRGVVGEGIGGGREGGDALGSALHASRMLIPAEFCMLGEGGALWAKAAQGAVAAARREAAHRCRKKQSKKEDAGHAS